MLRKGKIFFQILFRTIHVTKKSILPLQKAYKVTIKASYQFISIESNTRSSGSSEKRGQSISVNDILDDIEANDNDNDEY